MIKCFPGYKNLVKRLEYSQFCQNSPRLFYNHSKLHKYFFSSSMPNWSRIISCSLYWTWMSSGWSSHSLMTRISPLYTPLKVIWWRVATIGIMWTGCCCEGSTIKGISTTLLPYKFLGKWKRVYWFDLVEIGTARYGMSAPTF